LVGIDASKSITVNGQTVAARVNPDNGMELIIPLTLQRNTDYTVEIPQGAVYRKDDISVMADQKTISFSTRIGIDKNLVATSLTNANASTTAKSVYQFLLDNYGSRQLSGAMGEVAWGSEFTDFVASAGGAYPAIIGFDYIHLASSEPGSWVNYGDITPVSDAWNAGSLPAFSWHWLVPGSETKAVAEVWKEEPVDVGGWSNVIQIPADKFADAKVGQSIMVTISGLGENPQGSLKDSS
jgi:mannan endo-1,4-beta-mannosidase